MNGNKSTPLVMLLGTVLMRFGIGLLGGANLPLIWITIGGTQHLSLGP